MLFLVLNNGSNASNLTNANVSKSCCVIHLNTLPPYIFHLKGNNYKCIFNKVRRKKITVLAGSLVNPDGLSQEKDGLLWRMLLVKLAPDLIFCEAKNTNEQQENKDRQTDRKIVARQIDSRQTDR